jgi:hypothetical protein
MCTYIHKRHVCMPATSSFWLIMVKFVACNVLQCLFSVCMHGFSRSILIRISRRAFNAASSDSSPCIQSALRAAARCVHALSCGTRCGKSPERKPALQEFFFCIKKKHDHMSADMRCWSSCVAASMHKHALLLCYNMHTSDGHAMCIFSRKNLSDEHASHHPSHPVLRNVPPELVI